MTIAQNVLGVASNWSAGIVGSGYIFSGHNDSVPNTALVADAVDANNYSGTNNSSGDSTITNLMVGNTQRRILTLSNGNIIWDLAGNALEWSIGQATGGQPGITGGGWAWREFTTLTNAGTLSTSVTPANTGISGASSWISINGIGQICSNSDYVSIRSFYRGGSWNDSTYAGILSVFLCNASSVVGNTLGFRVTAPAF